MKKYLFKQTKKAFSLFLAVVMLMSCWVWIAPEEAKVAQAASAKDDYEVTFKYSIEGGKNLDSGTISYKTIGDGWSNTEDGDHQVGATLTSGTGGLGTNSNHAISFTTAKFPSVIKFQVHGPASEGCGDSKTYCRVKLQGIEINGVKVYDPDDSHKTGWEHNNDNWTGEFYAKLAENDLGTVAGGKGGTYTWARPHIAGFVDASGSATDSTGGKNPAINITLGKLGTSNVSKSTSFDIGRYTCVNQYGVAITNNTRDTLILQDKIFEKKSETTYISNNDNGGQSSDEGITANGDTVTVSPQLQVNKSNANTGTATYFLVKTYEYSDGVGGTITSRASAQINVQYPTYDITFNAKGTVDDAQFAPVIKVSGTDYINSYPFTGYYSAKITVPSDEDVTAEGYTFYGFWSEKQPTSGDGWFYSKKADFAQPISSETFTEHSKLSGAEVSGKVILVDTDGDGTKEKYYNAGTPLSGDRISKDETVYGWWCSNDYTVKFYDVDGKFIKEFAVKYGQTADAIMAQYGGVLPQSAYATYTSGAFTYKVVSGTWVNTDGTDITLSSHRFTDSLILTPKLTRDSFKNEYAVKFIDPADGSSVEVGSQGGVYNYRQNITNEADEAGEKIPEALTTDNILKETDLHYSYAFVGWTDVAPTDKNYHILLEDANFDVDGRAISLNNDWIVRDDTTYYAVYRRYTKSYDVKFTYKNTTGADTEKLVTLKYGDKLVPPADVPYEYNSRGNKYTFANWKYTKDQANNTGAFDKNATLDFTSENILIYSGALAGGSDPIVITAAYGAPVATPFKVGFTYPDDEGEDVTKSANVLVDKTIGDAFVGEDAEGNEIPFVVADELKPAVEFDDGEAVYSHAKSWKITSGAGTMGLGGAVKTVGDEILETELTGFVPTSDVEFEAVYANPVYYHNVTYIDGNNTFVGKALFGTEIPAWTNKVTNDNGTPDDTSDDYVEDKAYVPADYKGDGGTYVFQGWFDAKQTDETYATTNGNPITDYKTVPGDITFYSQFKFVPDTFTVEFKNYDGSQNIVWGEFQYGWSIEGLTAQANKGAQNSREDDPVYDYIFIGWDKTVPTFCEGKDLVFIAQYKAVYKYYNAVWYNSTAIKDDEGKIIGWEADESATLATTKHTYDSKLYTPSVDAFACPEAAPDGQNFVFAGWYYIDAEGKEQKYERGMKITADMEFHAAYTLTEKTFTVTAMVDGKPTDYTVASGKTAEIPDPQDGYVNEKSHNEFIGWYTDAGCTAKFEADTVITENITIYAKFEEEDHDFSNEQTKTNPTYYETGVKEVWCACDPSKKNDVTIPMLVDNVKPTGTIYLGSLGKWSSADEVGAAATDGDEVTLVANADTDIIITANDTGKKCTPETHTGEACSDCAFDALYNPSAIGKGVQLIRAFVYPGNKALTATGYGAAQEVAITVYENNTNNLTNSANFAIKLGDAYVADLDENGNAQYDENNSLKTKKLESGEVYIVYYYVIDKAGNQLNTKVRTAKFIYDNAAPVFTVEGFNNEAAIPTYCGTATVTGIENGAVLTVNGEVVEVAADGTYKINYAEDVDNVIITATDNAGNTYTKKIKVSDHNYLVREVLSSCLTPGYKEAECLICHHKKDRENYPATDHVMGQPAVTPADCFNNGYTVTKCENCDLEIKVEFEEDGTTPILPKLDHAYEMDGDKIAYTTVTEATCSNKGLAEAFCTACGEGRIEKILEINDENHEKTTIVHLDATCTDNGYHKEFCSGCGEVYKDDILTAAGHGETVWEIINEANCYQAGTMVEKCTVCTGIITDETAYGYTEEADGNYAYVTNKVTEGETETEVKVTEEIDGKVYYKYYLVPATGEHILRVTDSKEPTATEAGYIIRECQTPYCTEKKTETFKKLDSFTVTFLKEDGTELSKVENILTGDKIGKTDVTAPEKEADEKNTYAFAAWVEVIKNEDGTTTDGAVVKLPLTVSKNMTLKATYRATKILYTHTFYVPNVWVSPLEGMTGYDEYATFVGAHGEVLKPVSEPVFKLADEKEDAELKKLYTFKFKGWKDVLGNVVTDFKVTDSKEFYAYFEAIPVTYDVIYYNGTDYVWSTTVNGGDSVTYGNKVEIDGVETVVYPEKDFDDTYHYTFDKWYTDATLKTEYKGEAITSKTQLYAGFTAEEHPASDYVVDKNAGENKDGIVQKATCTLPELTQYICTCGHKKLVQTAEAKDHKDADGNSTLKTETVEKDDGIYSVVKCTICGEVVSETKTSWTVVFKNWNGVTLQTSVLNAGADIKFNGDEPARAEDEQYTYKFKGWCVYGDETETLVTLGKATEDAVYTAVFTKTAKTFRVTFVDVNNKTITTKAGLAYKYKLTAEDFPADQENYYTKNDHYTFVGWSESVGYEVKADLLVKPEFKVEGHKWYNTGETVGATCEEAGGVIWKCEDCEATETRDGAAATGHKWEVIEKIEPNLEKEEDGYYIEKCKVCGTVSEKIIIPAAKKKDVTITVKDSNGKPIHGALVELYNNGVRVDGADTNADGKVTFNAYEGKYTVLVSKVADAENVSFNINVGDKGYNGEAIMEIAVETCGCSCHRNGFWGIVFRFFQKIISFFTGKINCCADPDGRY